VSDTPSILPLGEGAWTVTLGDRVDARIHRQVISLVERIVDAGLPDVVEIVPAYAAVTVFFDPGSTDAEDLRKALATLAARPTSHPAVHPSSNQPSSARLVTIPVRYDGPDLAGVSTETGLPRDEVIRRHSAPEYRVYLLGFAPGFAYLGNLDPSLVLPRRATPRTRVPAGAVAIAGAQTAVYPLATPGGWHLIGSTSLLMFDPAREPAALLAAGDRVRFEPLS
jgi:KipI family sensor histidine kinase inhibitor